MNPTRKILALLFVLLLLLACTAPQQHWISTSPGQGHGNRAVLAAAQSVEANLTLQKNLPHILIRNPLPGSILPADMASPAIEWDDAAAGTSRWLVTLSAPWLEPIYRMVREPAWTPSHLIWDQVQAKRGPEQLTIAVTGLASDTEPAPLSRGESQISISADRVEAPILFRQVAPIFSYALKHPDEMKWRLGDVSSYDPPRVVMERQQVCGSCHHASADGQIFGMDIDYRKDKGAYALTPLDRDLMLTAEDFISWNDFPKIDGRNSTGLYSRISPDGKHVVSTVNEISLLIKMDDVNCSQLFYPLRGILAVYSLEDRRFRALPGADDRTRVQTAPEWSPDGERLLFSRVDMNQELIGRLGTRTIFASDGENIQQLNERYPVQFDIYQVPFNGGDGGIPTPVKGASQNGMSNYYPRYSPDGRWIVFTRSRTGLAIQPDAELYIMPAGGGEPRRMDCNPGGTTSWHTWSPNGRWIAFVSKARTPFTEIYLAHVDEYGRDAPAVRLARFSDPNLAANVPEFLNIRPDDLQSIKVLDAR